MPQLNQFTMQDILVTDGPLISLIDRGKVGCHISTLVVKRAAHEFI